MIDEKIVVVKGGQVCPGEAHPTKLDFSNASKLARAIYVHTFASDNKVHIFISTKYNKMKTLTFKFEQITNKVNKQTNEEIVTTCTFSANGNFAVSPKADNLERTKLFCSKLFNLLDVLKQGNKQMSVNGQKFNFSKEFNLYAVIDGKEISLDYGDLFTFDKIGFKCSAPTLRTNKQGEEQLNTKSRKTFTLQVWQLLQGAEGKTQLMSKSATKQVDASATASALYLLS